MSVKEKTVVCHMTTVHPYDDNRIYYKECRTLVEAGYEVFLVAPCHGPSLDGAIKLVPIQRESRRFLRMFWVSLFIAPVKALSTGAEIIHFHDPELIPAGLVLKLLFGKKVIYDLHEDLSGAIQSKLYIPNMVKGVISKVVKVIESMACKFLSGAVFARPDISSNFKFKNNSIILRNLPKLIKKNSTLNTLVKKSARFAVIYVGGMTSIRGIFELVEAFRHLPDHELWLLGPFRELGLEQKCRASEGWKRTRHLGVVSPEEIFEYINLADLGIVAFLPAPNHFTTLATKPFEYMSCALPMVLPDFSYWRSIFGDGAVYVNTADPTDIAKGIIHITSDSKKSADMGRGNKLKVENEFNWDIEKNKLINFYKTL